MPWQFLLLINLVFASLREALNKNLTNKAAPVIMVFYSTILSLVWLFVYQLVIRGTWPHIYPMMIASGIIYVIAFIAYYSAMKISLSQSILFQSYSVLITIFLSALFLGDYRLLDISQPVGQKIVSRIVLACLSLWFLLHEGGKRERKLEAKWFVAIGITIVLMGLGAFVSIFFSRQVEPVEVFINQSYLMIPVLLVFIFLRKQSLVVSRRTGFIMTVNSLVSVIAVLSFYEMLKNQSVARISPLQQVLLVVITMINSIVFFHESGTFTGKKLVGMVLGLVGVILLMTG
jgi:uncharacterized membrane protein